MPEPEDIKKDDGWDFAEYAFLITGIIVAVLLVVPEILESQFNISILSGSLNDLVLDEGHVWNFNQLRALSPLLFLLTVTIVFFKDAFDARKNGGYKGSLFTHTFESLLEDAIYMAITTIMVYAAVLFGAMYISWLAGPITWILFIFIFPLVKKKTKSIDEIDKTETPWLLLFIFAIGIIAEVITREWLAFPLSWLVICAIKLSDTINKKNHTLDTVFNIIYYAMSVIFMALGIGLNFWITSWMAFPIALVICWILSKFGKFKKVEDADR